MPTYQFEAMNAAGEEIKDVIEAPSEDEAQQTIKQMGYFITKISVKKGRKDGGKAGGKKKGRTFAIGGARTKDLANFTKNLSILQDAGLPILRSLRILEGQSKPGALKNALMDTCDEIESGSTLSEAMAKSPKCFNRLFVNMIKAGEAGGAMELILQRLSGFLERSEELKRKVKAALIYPVIVVLVACGILTFIMWKIVPTFKKMFDEFEFELPAMTVLLMAISEKVVNYFYLIPAIPLGIWLSILLLRKFKAGRMGWDLFIIRVPIFGPLIEKNVLARTTRTLGTLVASGVPILEGLTITRETAGNSMFEKMYRRVTDSIREGDTISRPMRTYSRPGFNVMACLIWFTVCSGPLFGAAALAMMPNFALFAVGAGVLGVLYYLMRMNQRIVDEIVVNMVDVGEETGELDTMLYKVADVYDDEVKTLTDGLMKLMEPLLILFLGGAVGFIVIALFLPLVKLIENLS